MNAIKNLCNRCVWLKDGVSVKESNDPHDIVRQYMQETVPANQSTAWENKTKDIANNHYVEFNSFRLTDSQGNLLLSNLNGDDEAYVEIEFIIKKINVDLQMGFALYDSFLNLIFLSYHTDGLHSQIRRFSEGKQTITTRLPIHLLNDGEYHLQLIAGIQHTQAILSRSDSEVTISFTISGNSKRSNRWSFKRSAMIAPILEWRMYE